MVTTTVRLPEVSPIILKLRPKPFNDPDWFFDLKYDGFRGLLYIDSGGARFISKQDNELQRFTALAERIAENLSIKNAILDGEIVVFDERQRPNFEDLIRQRREPSYVPFDLLWLNGIDLRNKPFAERRDLLMKIVPKRSLRIIPSLGIEERGEHFFTQVCKYDLEGIVAKRLIDPYRSTARWYKIKNPNYSQNEGRSRFFTNKNRRR